MSDYYDRLGIDCRASGREISRAYRRLARRYHPDVSAAPALTLEAFLAVQEAYETLSDPRRRASYDSGIGRQQPNGSPPSDAGSRGVRTKPRVVVRDVRHEQSPLDSRPSTEALSLLVSAALSLVAAAALGYALPGGARFVWVGFCTLLAVLASLRARTLAARQLERLWRWSAHGGRLALRRSRAARGAARRIQLADQLTFLGRRVVLVAVPIVFLLAGH
jgi:curved DNA-binding protein CbpA